MELSTHPGLQFIFTVLTLQVLSVVNVTDFIHVQSSFSKQSGTLHPSSPHLFVSCAVRVNITAATMRLTIGPTDRSVCRAFGVIRASWFTDCVITLKNRCDKDRWVITLPVRDSWRYCYHNQHQAWETFMWVLTLQS